MTDKPPTKRQRAINTIVSDVADNGKTTAIGLRAYAENRISMKTFQKAVADGRARYKAKRHQPPAEDQQRPAPSQSDESELPS